MTGRAGTVTACLGATTTGLIIGATLARHGYEWLTKVTVAGAKHHARNTQRIATTGGTT